MITFLKIENKRKAVLCELKIVGRGTIFKHTDLQFKKKMKNCVYPRIFSNFELTFCSLIRIEIKSDWGRLFNKVIGTHNLNRATKVWLRKARQQEGGIDV